MRNNIKLIIGIIIGMILVSGVSVYATLTYSAGDIAYTKSGSSTPISVSSALNELYQNKKETTDDVKNITANGNITLDKYYKNVNVNVPIPAGYIQPSGTKTITTKANNIDVSNYQYADTSGMYTSTEYQNYGTTQYNNGKSQNVYKNTNFQFQYDGNNWVDVHIGFRPSFVFIDADNGYYDFFFDGDSAWSYMKKTDNDNGYKNYMSVQVLDGGFRYKFFNGCSGLKGTIYAVK